MLVRMQYLSLSLSVFCVAASGLPCTNSNRPQGSATCGWMTQEEEIPSIQCQRPRKKPLQHFNKLTFRNRQSIKRTSRSISNLARQLAILQQI